MFPPIVLEDWLEGSGANINPRPLTAWVIQRFGTPASTRARRFRSSTFKIRFSRVVAMTTPPSTASTAPLRLVPVPRGMIGTLCAAQILTTSTVSAVLRGNTTASGGCFSIV